VQKAAHVADVLDGQRLVEPVVAADLLDHFSRRPLARHEAGRIARDGVGDDERQQADAEQHDHQQDDPAGDDVS
jgi:hypothetical protein